MKLFCFLVIEYEPFHTHWCMFVAESMSATLLLIIIDYYLLQTQMRGLQTLTSMTCHTHLSLSVRPWVFQMVLSPNSVFEN